MTENRIRPVNGTETTLLPELPDPGAPNADQLIELSVRTPAKGIVVLGVSGEVDMFTTPLLRTALDEQLTSKTERLVLDLSQVSFLGSSGLAVLVDCLHLAEDNGVGFCLVSSTRSVERPLKVTGLGDVFSTFPTVSAALAA
ncbi:STAS domain-containing protein [Allokutzneria sp. NRRL B-24872]|uniref:STAS domain-containing protein n=1 Tax=Allokutzneria sp. NRRL B-24872 TaxID=1137961 RepID=UPI001AEF9F18|nr:STAS domain-containing protein [Allokutzneria sp. NRRL B-24872]